MTRIFLAASALALLSAQPATAQDAELSVTTGIDFVSQYVFRGASLADNAVQPYAEVSSGNFTAGTWVSLGIGENSVAGGDEVDFYIGYSVPLDSSISQDLGATYYHYPQGGNLFETKEGGAGTYEISAAVGFGEVPLAPSIAGYYDFTLEAFTLEGSVGHSLPVGNKNSFDLGLTAGHVEADGPGDYQWATASAAFSVPISDMVSTYAGASYTLNSENVLDFDAILRGDPKDNLLWVGTGISAGF